MALNYVKGIISHKGEIKSGQSQSGRDWSRQIVVLDIASYGNTYSKIALSVQNDKVNELERYALGARVEIGYSVTAREWEGKWYNNVDLITITSLDEGEAPAESAAPAARVQRPAKTTPLTPPGEAAGDDLPF